MDSGKAGKNKELTGKGSHDRAESAVRRTIPEFLDQKFKKILIIGRTLIRSDAQPRGHHISDALSVLLADFRRNVQPAGKKRFNQLGFRHGELGSLGNDKRRVSRGVEEES